MTPRSRLRSIVVGAIAATFILTGCSTPSYYEPYPPEPEPLWVDPEPPEKYPTFPDTSAQPGVWECFWDPTMNDNWYDDILCSDGINYDRPLLLTDWDFVTQEDMLAEAAAYEAYLNGY